jgi:hypothetical protein
MNEAEPEPAAGGVRAAAAAARLDWSFLAVTLAVFLLTRLVGLERFPIFFFCDEAVQANRAASLVEHRFHDDFGTLLPTYFENGGNRNLGVGVYLQALPAYLFGRSIFVTRAVQVLALATAMLALGLILRDAFRLRFWWLGPALLSAFPGWFLHTRIAFELMLAVAFYVWFLYFYLRYRSGRPRSAYLAVLFGALVFYGYNTFQPAIVATCLLLLIVDAPYHWRNRRTLLRCVPLLALAVLPYVRFVREFPDETERRLRSLSSPVTAPGMTRGAKLAAYGRQYALAYSPAYWFLPERPEDIPRQQMKGRSHLGEWSAPLVAAGLLICAWRIRRPAERTLLVALAAAPVGAALVAPGITRCMNLVVLAALFAAIAGNALLTSLPKRLPPALVGGAACALLAALPVALLADSLRHGETWYTNYGLDGMQWGSREVFGAARRYRERYPDQRLMLSPDWANGADELLHFFLPGDPSVDMANVDWLQNRRGDIPEPIRFILLEPEFRAASADPRLRLDALEETISYPDGTPGFRIARWRYAPDYEAIMSARREDWHHLIDEEVTISGEKVRVSHSRFDGGEVGQLFDGDPETLARTESSNPAVVVLEFPRGPSHAFRRLLLTTGSMDSEIVVTVTGEAREETVRRTYRGQPDDPTLDIELPAVGGARRVRIEARDLNAAEPSKVHLREVRLLE